MVDAMVYVINCWLLLQHARADERKRAIAQVYIAEHLPNIKKAVAAIQAADPGPLQVRDVVLASPF